MKRVFAVIAVAAGLVASGSAWAGGALGARVGVNGGNYSLDYSTTDLSCGGPCGPASETNDNETVYGINVGLNLVVAAFFADLGIEYSQYADAEDFNRSDATLTLGGFIGNFQVFGGYRRGEFGDGFFSSDNPSTFSTPVSFFAHSEYGPFIGAGVGFKLGKSANMGFTLAYNSLTYETPSFGPLTDLDYNGFSAKLQVGLPGNVQTYLRWQRFEADQTQPGSFSEDLSTEYIVLGVQKGFTFTSW